jgi:hypothetical protein
MEQHLQRRGIPVRCFDDSRALRGGLFAHAGHGLVFIDGSDTQSEQRFSVAHELGHFIVDYLEPRLRVIRLLGVKALEVLDGKRNPTIDERINGVLADASMRPHFHTMARDPDVFTGIDEIGADKLAFEMLAPAAEVLDATKGASKWQRRAALEELLTEIYRLPVRAAHDYCAMLLRNPDIPPIRKQLGF